ncbi:MAG TPA: YcbK family protein [Candidatus Limnocylindria bacterium]|nr:YcbK family protein [Candidatus Limnocylindria bacterium]
MPHTREQHAARLPTRRALLRMGALVGATLLPAGVARARPCRSLSLYAVQTGERLAVDYCIDGRYEPEALRAIAHLLRDVHADRVHQIDVTLLDALWRIRRILGTRSELHVVSGYRTHETNEQLRRRDRAVAANSYHVSGKAVDFFVPGRQLASVRYAAHTLHAGGVGYYPKSGFLHLDTGPQRRW